MERLERPPWARTRYRCLDAHEFLTRPSSPSQHWMTRLLYGSEVTVEFPLLLCSYQEKEMVTLGDITGRFAADLHGRLVGRTIVGEYLYLPEILRSPGRRPVLLRYDPRESVPIGITPRARFAQ